MDSKELNRLIGLGAPHPSIADALYKMNDDIEQNSAGIDLNNNIAERSDIRIKAVEDALKPKKKPKKAKKKRKR